MLINRHACVLLCFVCGVWIYLIRVIFRRENIISVFLLQDLLLVSSDAVGGDPIDPPGASFISSLETSARFHFFSLGSSVLSCRSTPSVDIPRHRLGECQRLIQSILCVSHMWILTVVELRDADLCKSQSVKG